jgi:DNA-binding GntR family transcriptional regulator
LTGSNIPDTVHGMPHPGKQQEDLLVPVTRDDLGSKVYERLALAITENQLKPGERLVEDEVAARLGVSKTPVRGALIELERDGLVESRPPRGKYVKSMSARDAEEIYSLRAALEGMACYLAAPKVTEAQVEELLGICAKMRQHAETGNISMLSKLDRQFHEALCVLSDNRRLVDDWRRMSGQILLLSRRVIDTRYQGHLDAIADRHEYLANLLAQHDSKAAEAAAREHIESVAIRITSALRELEEGQ